MESLKINLNNKMLNIEFINIKDEYKERLVNLFREVYDDIVKDDGDDNNGNIIEIIKEEVHDIKEELKNNNIDDVVNEIMSEIKDLKTELEEITIDSDEEITDEIEIIEEDNKIPLTFSRINMNEMKSIYDKPFKENTMKKYKNCIRKISTKFCDDIETFMNEYFNNFIDFVNNLENEESTKKDYISALLCVFRNINIQDEDKINKLKNMLKDLKESLNNKQNIKEVITKEQSDKYYNEILNIYNEVKNDINKSNLVFNHNKNNYTQLYKKYLMAKFIIDYGVLRDDEFRLLKICDNNNCIDVMNYFNIDTNQLIIQEHKNSNKIPIRIIKISDEYIDLIKHRNGKYFLTNTKDDVYSRNDKFNDNCAKKWFNYTITQLRHINTAHKINIEYEKEIDLLENIQGHHRGVMKSHYIKVFE